MKFYLDMMEKCSKCKIKHGSHWIAPDEKCVLLNWLYDDEIKMDKIAECKTCAEVILRFYRKNNGVPLTLEQLIERVQEQAYCFQVIEVTTNQIYRISKIKQISITPTEVYIECIDKNGYNMNFRLSNYNFYEI